MLWICSLCGHSGMSTAIPNCPGCGHIRCPDCFIFQVPLGKPDRVSALPEQPWNLQHLSVSEAPMTDTDAPSRRTSMRRYDTNKFGSEKLRLAVVSGSVGQALHFLREGHSGEKHRALILAARLGQSHMPTSILREEFQRDEVDYVDEHGLSPLHYGARHGLHELISLLLQYGADINILSQSEGAPIHYAIESGDLETVTMLIDHGANIDICPVEGLSPLHHAISLNAPEMVAALLKRGAQPSNIDPEGHSPLSFAVFNGREECVRMLLECDVAHGTSHSHQLGIDNTDIFPPAERLVAQFGWEIPHVVEEIRREHPQRDLIDSMCDFVTLTGSGQNYDCSSCQDFLSKAWPSFGMPLFKGLIQNSLDAENRDANRPILVSGVEVSVWRLTRDRLIIYLPLNCQHKRDILDAVRWMCAAVRLNPHRLRVPGEGVDERSLQLSKALSEVWVGETSWELAVTYFNLQPLERFQADLTFPNTMCWTHLFNTAVVADCPIRRTWGYGLEVSFDLMIQLASVETYYYLDSGIILLGYFTALVPITKDCESRSIQWHLEFVDKTEDCLRISNLDSTKGNWFKTSDKKLLQESKCFLGWSESANIALGTRALCQEKRLRASDNTADRYRAARLEGYEAGIQAGFSLGPILSLVPKVTSSWVFHSTVQRFSAPSSYVQAINLSRGKVALVIDSKAKRAWLVPFLSLALHLCHRYWQEHGDISSSPIPFADLQPDGAAAAHSALVNNGDLVVFSGGTDVETLRSLFLRINSNLLATARIRELSKKDVIFASELLDIVTEPSVGSALKEIRVPEETQAWLPLVERVDCVAVCADLGLAIQPVALPPSTCSCYVLPEDRFYLAAHMWCLDQLGQKVGGGFDCMEQGTCRLGKGIVWQPGSLLWPKCNGDAIRHKSVWDEDHRVSILQRVSAHRSEKKLRTVQGITNNPSIPTGGVVVFGEAEHPRRFETLAAWRDGMREVFGTSM